MDVSELLAKTRDELTVRRVYGDPVERDGTTVIPVARVRGGGGGGTGEKAATGEKGQESGSGGGFGVDAAPVGVYVIRNGTVKWQPAIDVNRVILGGQIVAVIALFTLRALIKRFRR
jgi:uncharacterized spore protein YtfJ